MTLIFFRTSWKTIVESAEPVATKYGALKLRFQDMAVTAAL